MLEGALLIAGRLFALLPARPGIIAICSLLAFIGCNSTAFGTCWFLLSRVLLHMQINVIPAIRTVTTPAIAPTSGKYSESVVSSPSLGS